MNNPPRSWKCLVIDDEPLAAELLVSYIEKLEELELAGVCHNALDAFTLLQRQPVDLIFLDIQMPRLTGLEFLRALSSPPSVIITTAYREYAVEGFELDVVDYLVKPVSLERFLKALGKLLVRRQGVMAETESTTPPAEDPYLYFKVDKEMVKVYLKDILWIESIKDYVKIKTPSTTLITYQRISYLEEKLPEQLFLRIHRSYIVATNKLEAYSHTFVRLHNTELPIGKSYKQGVYQKLSAGRG